MNAGIEAGRALALGGSGLIAAATGWGLILGSAARVWDAGPFRREPGFRPFPRPPSSGAAILTATAALALWIAGFVVLPHLGALKAGHGPVGPGVATRAAGVAWVIAAGGVVLLIVVGLAFAEVGVLLRGQAVLRYPNPRTGVLLGGGLGLVAGTAATSVTSIVLGLHALGHSRGPGGDFSAIAAWAIALAVATLPAVADGARRLLPALRLMARNEAMSRPTLR